jgi:starvation-inducible DNA-binding protein
VQEETGQPTANDMLRQLVADQETVVRTAHEVIDMADGANDEPTADLLTQRMQLHEKNA